MIFRRFLVVTALLAIAAIFFALGSLRARANDEAVRASYDAKLDAIRAEVRSEIGKGQEAVVERATAGAFPPAGEPADAPRLVAAAAPQVAAAAPLPAAPSTSRTALVNEVKQQLAIEMGLVPVQLLRDRRSSFVELYSTDSANRVNYGTAGYLGGGYFITVKHAVIALRDEDGAAADRKIVSIVVRYHGKDIPAQVVDTGNADVEVHSGDWAIIKTKNVDLPPLHPDTAFGYDFAAPIFRLGNDYSKGIILSTGYVGQRMSNGLVSSLTDGHPGVSGGGVLDQHGDLVGIPIGRMQGDYRFSFILPLRAEMLRKVPFASQRQADATVAVVQ
jgi:hypothetical protein